LSRKSSASTILQVQKSSPIVTEASHREVLSNKSGASLRERTPSPTAAISASSSSSESRDEAPASRSKAYARRSRPSSSRAPLGPLSDADEDLEDSPPFLPFSEKNPTKAVPPTNDPGATVKLSPRLQKAHLAASKPGEKPKNPPVVQPINSSSSSAQSQPTREAKSTKPPLSSLSPRQRRIAKEGSDGTPSMGSSFSDLDDASVTQSALEEALANEMRHGSGVASRMSTISQALRSRYL